MWKKYFMIFLLITCLITLSGCDWLRGKKQPNMANPASVYCEQHDGKLDMRQDANGGTVGICVFADKSECDEWAYFRGECKPGDVIPDATPPATE